MVCSGASSAVNSIGGVGAHWGGGGVIAILLIFNSALSIIIT